MQDIKKFVINLKRRPDRLETFKTRCPFTDVEVVHGFDGKNVWTEQSYKEKNNLYKFQKLKPGEKGVFISHTRIFQRIIEENLSYALIFEDDAEFCDNFTERLKTVIQELPNDTSILYIGGRFDPEFKMTSCSSISDHIVRHNQTTWIGEDMDRTLHAYIISKDLAQICINEFYRSILIDEAIDSWIMKICKKYSLPIYNAQPLLCHSPLISNSDIR
jgi:glycosyl transferase family 25